MLTVNVTTGKRAEQLLDEVTNTVDVLSCQEVTWTEAECLRMESLAEANQWRMEWAPCLRGEKRCKSAGACICVRIWLQAEIAG